METSAESFGVGEAKREDSDADEGKRDGPTRLVAHLPEGVSIADSGDGQYIVYEDSTEIARIPDFLPSLLPTNPLDSDDGARPVSTVDAVFTPPEFGITFLGTSHGFDGGGTTSGFVVWMHGHGVMVDPPPHSARVLRQNGILPRQIDYLVLTHCHADHDAGTFQKILQERKV